MSDNIELQKIIGEVAAAYFANSHVSPAEIPVVIGHIATSLGAVGAPVAPEAPAEDVEAAKATPAQVRKSITREALISFEDNKPYKTLRRHLAVRGLTPDEYRSKWGLPKDYPMVAPSYSEARSSLAKAAGLGSRFVGRPQAIQPAAPQPPEPAAVPAAPSEAPAAATASKPKSVAKGRGRPLSAAPKRPRKAREPA